MAAADVSSVASTSFRFRPCIDLHAGKVKQIVGSSLRDAADGKEGESSVVTNFETNKKPSEFAELYKSLGLTGGHVIMLGPGNTEAALEAVRAYPGGLQVGGGITAANCKAFLDAGASHVIVTSFVFKDGKVNWENLRALVEAAGGKQRVVLDLSCRKRPRTAPDSDAADAHTTDGKSGTPATTSAGGVGAASVSSEDAAETTDYFVVTDRWQRFTDVAISKASLEALAPYCAELLVHGVDVEGMQAGVEEPLVEALGRWATVPVTYAGGVRSLEDVDTVRRLGRGRVDVSIGSALDTFGGPLLLRDVLEHVHPTTADE